MYNYYYFFFAHFVIELFFLLPANTRFKKWKYYAHLVHSTHNITHSNISKKKKSNNIMPPAGALLLFYSCEQQQQQNNCVYDFNDIVIEIIIII